MTAEFGLLIAAIIAIYYQCQTNRIQMLEKRTTFYFEMRKILNNIKTFMENFEEYNNFNECNNAMEDISNFSTIFHDKKEEAKLLYGNYYKINKVFALLEGPIEYCNIKNDKELKGSVQKIKQLGGYKESILPQINKFERVLLEETMVESPFNWLKRWICKIICY